MDLIRERCVSCGRTALIEKIVFRGPAVVVRRCEHDGNRWVGLYRPIDVFAAGLWAILILGLIVAGIVSAVT